MSDASPYSIERHKHRFAAWAASRAASVKGYRFPVEKGRKILEDCGLDENFSMPEQLPASKEAMNKQHRQWREKVIQASKNDELNGFSHGVAAKLINVYLKCRFVCGGYHAHESVGNLHPPLDEVLLETLAERDIGGSKKEWRKARMKRWSKFTSDDYEDLIEKIRQVLQDQPLWKIEEYWQGYQSTLPSKIPGSPGRK